MRMLKCCILISLALWIVGFVIGYHIAGEDSKLNSENYVIHSDLKNQVLDAVENNDNFKAFVIIAKNNILCTMINIGGGAFFSIPTLFNLPFYGYVIGFQIHDIIYAPVSKNYKQRLVRLLPHSAELIGIMGSGAISFYITYIICYLLINPKLINRGHFVVLIQSIIYVFIIIIVSAFIEAYYSYKL